jgi:iron complex transport system substrate-binding protein
VAELGKTLRQEPQVLSLNPILMEDVLEDIRRVGRATGKEGAANALTGELQARLDAVVSRASQAASRPRVLQLEWTDPLLCGGHWVVEMVELAGGISSFGSKDQGSQRLDWDEVVGSQPEVILLMPCGYDLDRAKEDIPTLTALPGWDSLPAVQAGRAYVLDAAAYTSRLGPRLVTGLEMMAELIHPELFSGMIPEGASANFADVS